MSFARITITVFLLSALWFEHANADPCRITGPRYNLDGDTVSWSLEISVGHNCVSGVRFANVAIQSVSLVSKPIHGQAELKGWGFTYSADAKIGQKDSFSIAVVGSISGKSGTSLIQIEVSVAPPQYLAGATPSGKGGAVAPAGAEKMTTEQRADENHFGSESNSLFFGQALTDQNGDSLTDEYGNVLMAR